MQVRTRVVSDGGEGVDPTFEELCHNYGQERLQLMFHDKTKLNCGIYYDPAHGNNRDWWCSVGDLGLEPFCMIMMVLLNLRGLRKQDPDRLTFRLRS